MLFRELDCLINLPAKKVLEVGIMNEVCAAILVSVRNIKACLEKKLCSCCFLTSQLGGHWTSLTSPRYVSRLLVYHKSLSNNYQYFYCLLDKRVAKICKKLKIYGCFLSTCKIGQSVQPIW